MNFRNIAATAPQTFRKHRLRIGIVDDPQDLIDLVDACSPESRHLRFHTGMPALRPSMAEKLAATPSLGLRSRRGKLVAEARYTPTAPGEAELAILIADRYQRRGLGAALLAVLFEQAQAEGITTLTADVLASNDAILALLAKLAPVETVGIADGSRRLRISLLPVAAAA